MHLKLLDNFNGTCGLTITLPMPERPMGAASYFPSRRPRTTSASIGYRELPPAGQRRLVVPAVDRDGPGRVLDCCGPVDHCQRCRPCCYPPPAPTAGGVQDLRTHAQYALAAGHSRPRLHSARSPCPNPYLI